MKFLKKLTFNSCYEVFLRNTENTLYVPKTNLGTREYYFLIRVIHGS